MSTMGLIDKSCADLGSNKIVKFPEKYTGIQLYACAYRKYIHYKCHYNFPTKLMILNCSV